MGKLGPADHLDSLEHLHRGTYNFIKTIYTIIFVKGKNFLNFVFTSETYVLHVPHY